MLDYLLCLYNNNQRDMPCMSCYQHIDCTALRDTRDKILDLEQKLSTQFRSRIFLADKDSIQIPLHMFQAYSMYIRGSLLRLSKCIVMVLSNNRY